MAFAAWISSKRLDLYGLAHPSGKSKDMIWQKVFCPAFKLHPRLWSIISTQPTLARHLRSEATITIYTLRISLNTSTKPSISPWSFINILRFFSYVASCSLVQLIQYGLGPVSRVWWCGLRMYYLWTIFLLWICTLRSLQADVTTLMVWKVFLGLHFGSSKGRASPKVQQT